MRQVRELLSKEHRDFRPIVEEKRSKKRKTQIYLPPLAGGGCGDGGGSSGQGSGPGAPIDIGTLPMLVALKSAFDAPQENLLFFTRLGGALEKNVTSSEVPDADADPEKHLLFATALAGRVKALALNKFFPDASPVESPEEEEEEEESAVLKIITSEGMEKDCAGAAA